MPLPLTARVVSTSVWPVQVASFGPYSRNLISPPAGAPAAPLMTGLPGCVAVPPSVAVSANAVPTATGPDAFVLNDGSTGVTRKHSPSLESELFGTPCVSDTKSPRQQYRPAEVIVTVSEVYVPFAVTVDEPAAT